MHLEKKTHIDVFFKKRILFQFSKIYFLLLYYYYYINFQYFV